MATLPTPDSIALDTPRPDAQPASYPRQFGGPGVVGEAIERVGQDQQQQQDQADEFDYAKARSQYLVDKTDLESKLQDDPDWKSAPANYTTAMQALQQQYAGQITNPRFRQRFQMESGVDFASGLAAVNHYVRGRAIDQGRGDLENTLNANLLGGLSNQKDAQGFIASTQSALDGAVASGFITDAESVDRRIKWLSDYGKGYLSLLPPDQRLKLLTGSATPRSLQVTPTAASVGGASSTVPRAEDVVPMLDKAIPGYAANVTGLGRTPAQNAADGGVADSDHLQDHAIDSKPIPGMTFDQFHDKVLASGAIPAGARVQIIDETAPDAPHSTGPHWHVGWRDMGAGTNAGGQAAPTQPPDLTVIPKTNTAADFVPITERAIMAHEAEVQVRENGAFGRQQALTSLNDDMTWLRSGGDPTQVRSTPDGARTSIGGPEGDAAASALQDAQRYGAAVRQLKLAPQSQVDSILSGFAPNSPIGFRENAADFADLQRVAADRNTALRSDAAGYVVDADPTVKAAYQAYAGATDPTAQSAAFDAYVHRLNASYDQLQIPADQRPIIPLADAKNIVSKIENGTPQDAAKLLQGMKGVSGRWWLPTYGALARAGLPAWVQAVSVASPQDQPTMIAALQHSTSPEFKAYTDLVPHDQIASVAGQPSPLDTAIQADTGLANLKASMVAYGRGGAAIYDGTQKAVRTTALYLMATQHMTTDAAVTRAAGMVTGSFDFMPQTNGPPARLPKGTLDTVTAATSSRLASLKPGDVQPYGQIGDEHGAVVGSTPQERQQAALDSAQHAWWMTITGPDGSAMLRAIDPATNAPVMLSGGRTLDLPVGQPPAPGTAAMPAQSAMVPGKPAHAVDRAIREGSHQPGAPRARR